MRTFFLLIILFCSVLNMAIGENTELPKIITNGFEIYKKEGSSKAFDSWLAGSPLEKDTTTKINVLGGITQIEAAYGKFCTYEYLASIVFNQYVTRYYVVGIYEKGPLYMWFEVFSKDGKDILPSFDCNTKANLILPESFLRKK